MGPHPQAPKPRPREPDKLQGADELQGAIDEALELERERERGQRAPSPTWDDWSPPEITPPAEAARGGGAWEWLTTLLPGVTAVAGGGTAAWALWLAATLWRRRRQRRAAAAPRREPVVIPLDREPQPGRVHETTRFVEHPVDDYRAAHQWAREQLGRRSPGTISMLEQEQSLIEQYLAGLKAKREKGA